MKIAIIPARGGSKRIPKKNILDFFGQPMIVRTLKQIQRSGVFDKIHVSTDDQEIVQVVESFDFPVEFKRPAHLADDHTPVLDAVRWVVEEYEKQQLSFDLIATIMPCSPLIQSDDYQKALDIFLRYNKKWPLMAMAPYPCPVEWAFADNSNGIFAAENPKLLKVRSQDLKPKYYDTGNFYFLTRDQLFNMPNKTIDRCLSYYLPQQRAVDIDSLEDLDRAKALFQVLDLE